MWASVIFAYLASIYSDYPAMTLISPTPHSIPGTGIEVCLTVHPGYEAWNLGFILDHLAIQTAFKFHRLYFLNNSKSGQLGGVVRPLQCKRRNRNLRLIILSDLPISLHLHWHPQSKPSSLLIWALASTSHLVSLPTLSFPPIHSFCSHSVFFYCANVPVLFHTFWWASCYPEDKLQALYCGWSLFMGHRYRSRLLTRWLCDLGQLI